MALCDHPFLWQNRRNKMWPVRWNSPTDALQTQSPTSCLCQFLKHIWIKDLVPGPVLVKICMQTDCTSLWLNRKAFWGRGLCSEKEMNQKGTGHLQYPREARSVRVVMWVTVAMSPGGQSTDRVFPLHKMILLCPFPFRVCPMVQLTTFFFYFFAFRSDLLSNCQAV